MRKFKITHQSGEARCGEIRVNGKKLETPFLYPVLAFFCGGNWSSKFGGGIYRQIKENFLMKKEFQKYFQGVMTSIAQLNDFPVSREKLNGIYTSKTIHEWFNFDGILFVDSGGFKLLTNDGINGQDFKITSPEDVLHYQIKFGADILVSLDYPISPNLKESEVKKRIRKSIENAIFLLENKPRSTLAYIAVHGYSKENLKKYIEKILSGLEKENVSLKRIDGIAIGSLVPLKGNIFKILEIVKGCKEVLKEFSLDSLPLHVFGISSTLLPLLVMLGVDTFDSSTYLYSAIKGIYLRRGLQRMNIKQLRRKTCDCDICKNEGFFKLITKAEKNINSIEGSVIAMHNLIVFCDEVKKLKEVIKENHEEKIRDYIQSRFNHSPLLRKGIWLLNNNLKEKQ
jgi:tRNA-guanine family transglycosylase